MNITKECSKCHFEKELSQFRPSSKHKYGVMNYCIVCQDNYAKEHYEKNRLKRINQIKIATKLRNKITT